MALKPINTPSDEMIEGGNGKVKLQWSPSFGSDMTEKMTKKQKIVDSEVLRLCSPMVPHRTGKLEQSGTVSTVIGSGQVKYATPYARRQYYQTATSRSYDPNRGAKWFERMKTKHKDEILQMLKE